MMCGTAMANVNLPISKQHLVRWCRLRLVLKVTSCNA